MAVHEKEPNRSPHAIRLSRDRIMVSIGRHYDHELRVAREYALGAEVQTFANPLLLATDFEPLLKRVARRVAALPGSVGCHGPFIDTTHFSYDTEIMAASRRRYLQAMDIAERLGARFVLFHSQYNPLIKIPTYPEIYHSQSLLFWPDMLEEAERRGLPIYLENMFDDSPEPLRRLADELDSPYLKLCLDPAHVHLHSELTLDVWLERFQPHLAHVHLSDCHGVFDDHLALGEGCVDLPLVLRRLHGADVTFALETGTGTRPSLRYLGIPRNPTSR